MDKDRRAAEAWAQEWQIKQKNRRIIKVLAIIAIIIALYFVIHFITIKATRTTFSSEEEMRSALQGRYETDYVEDIEIIGDEITLTYYEVSHYDIEYAEKYGYSEYDDYVYEDTVAEWDYREGVIRGNWMSEIRVDKDGNLRYYSQTYKKTDADKPVPFDPSLLKSDTPAADADEEFYTDDEEAGLEESRESLDQTEEAAEDAGILADAENTGE